MCGPPSAPPPPVAARSAHFTLLQFGSCPLHRCQAVNNSFGEEAGDDTGQMIGSVAGAALLDWRLSGRGEKGRPCTEEKRKEKKRKKKENAMTITTITLDSGDCPLLFPNAVAAPRATALESTSCEMGDGAVWGSRHAISPTNFGPNTFSLLQPKTQLRSSNETP